MTSSSGDLEIARLISVTIGRAVLLVVGCYITRLGWHALSVAIGSRENFHRKRGAWIAGIVLTLIGLVVIGTAWFTSPSMP